jgi:hypothetical protein
MDFLGTMKRTQHPSIRFAAVACFIALALSASPQTWAKKRKAPAQPAADSNYVAGLATANRLLDAWQNNDLAGAMPLITNRAKQQATEEGLDKLFSGPTMRAFEISRGRSLRPDSYQFSIVLLQADDSGHTRRRFAELVVINTGKNDWAVDKLP